ncbi:hypothetical protein [Enemella sp. A6]|uniref:hypothetical protein n=1 Tax=Enemella sp. A6 TaxID=3440152 RepID=UPI003EB8F58F
MNEAGPLPCPNCGTRTEANAAACPRCGLPRNNPVFGPDNSYLGTTFAPVRQARPTPPASRGGAGGPGYGAAPAYGPPPEHTPSTVPEPMSTGSLSPEQQSRKSSQRRFAILLGAVVVILLGVAAGLIIANLPSGDDTVAVPASQSAVEPTAAPSRSDEPQPTESESASSTPTPSASLSESSEPSSSPESSPTSTPVEPDPTPIPTSVPAPSTKAPPPPRRDPGDSGPVSGTEEYVAPGSGARCIGPAGWDKQDYEGGLQWYTDDGEVLCGATDGGTDRVRAMVEQEWAQNWKITLSRGDARQYRASGYTDDGRIFWLGAKNRPGSAKTALTYWIYPKSDKKAYDSYVEQAWQRLTPP